MSHTEGPENLMQERWERFAAEDPVHAILALDRPVSDAEFYAGGRLIVADMMGWAFAGVARGRLLEIGCGMGRTAAAFAGEFARVDALDVSALMVQKARARCSAENLHFHVGDGATLGGFEDESIDAVFSFLVFQHIPRAGVVRGLLREVARVLRAGGVACIQFDTRARSLVAELYKSLPDAVLPREHRRFMRRYRRDAGELRGWMREAGLEVVRERGAGTDTHFFVMRKHS